MNNKSIKFKIELTSDNLSREDITRIYDQITNFIDSVSDLIEMTDINTTIMKEEIVPKYTGKYEGEEEMRQKEIKETINSFKEKFHNEDSFQKHIGTLSKFKNKHPARGVDAIQNYLITNGPSRLWEIIDGCKEQGLKSKSKSRKNEWVVFHQRVKKLVERGLVNKEGRIYIWNYKED